MYMGRINKEFRKEEISQDALISASFGVEEGRVKHA